MEIKKLKTESLASLIISVIPAAALIPVFLKITLPKGVSTAWAGVNIGCAVGWVCFSPLSVSRVTRVAAL